MVHGDHCVLINWCVLMDGSKVLIIDSTSLPDLPTMLSSFSLDTIFFTPSIRSGSRGAIGPPGPSPPGTPAPTCPPCPPGPRPCGPLPLRRWRAAGLLRSSGASRSTEPADSSPSVATAVAARIMNEYERKRTIFNEGALAFALALECCCAVLQSDTTQT
eukprot:CAMPEP_0119483944 /NCGR_PEP_ID=MMETSP1344-20130328/11121_1 /TAXON_ID=236787 /ORGANISM="Florenciella parvula, Strain CCMP2471" /LENGTH=159 /DNA_ID=CAMNT_0007518475 /DNA_START=332 /DNA_END=812 /DNA_ORIENTATION=-